MLRSRRLLLGFLLAFGLVVTDPPQLDLLRYPLALVASWPARVVAAWFEPAGRDPATMRAQANLQADQSAQAFRAETHFPVFHSDSDRRYLFLVGGWAQKIVQGDRVVLDDQFLGFVDRVEERWCRARVLGHPDLHLGGSIDLGDAVLEPGMHQQLLLSGTGYSSLVSRQGSRIDPRLLGHEVRTIATEDLSLSWRVGRIGFDPRLDTEVVAVDLDLEALNEVQVLGRRPEHLRPRLDVEALVLAHGGGGTETKNWLLGRGSTDGVRVGAWVSAGGVLVGRIIRCGLFSSRMLTLADSQVEIMALDPQTGAGLPWHSGETEHSELISRGRVRDASLPRGLRVPPASAPGQQPVTAEILQVHVADDQQALLRLGVQR